MTIIEIIFMSMFIKVIGVAMVFMLMTVNSKKSIDEINEEKMLINKRKHK